MGVNAAREEGEGKMIKCGRTERTSVQEGPRGPVTEPVNILQPLYILHFDCVGDKCCTQRQRYVQILGYTCTHKGTKYNHQLSH